MDILPGETELILCRCYQSTHTKKKANGVTGEPMPKSAFLAINESTMKIAGYLRHLDSYIRWGLGKRDHRASANCFHYLLLLYCFMSLSGRRPHRTAKFMPWRA